MTSPNRSSAFGNVFILPGQEQSVRDAAEIERRILGLRALGVAEEVARLVLKRGLDLGRKSVLPTRDWVKGVFDRADLLVAIEGAKALEPMLAADDEWPKGWKP